MSNTFASSEVQKFRNSEKGERRDGTKKENHKQCQAHQNKALQTKRKPNPGAKHCLWNSTAGQHIRNQKHSTKIVCKIEIHNENTTRK